MTKAIMPKDVDRPLHFDASYRSKIDICHSLLDIITNKRVTPYFNPIVNLRNGDIYSYCVTCYGPEGNELHTPEQLMEAACYFNVQQEFQDICDEMTAQVAIDKGLKNVFLNHNPNQATEVIFKLTFTHSSIQKQILTIHQLLDVHNRDMINDIGIEHHQSQLEVQPKYIVIGREWTHKIDKKTSQQLHIRGIVAYAHAVGATVLATDISTTDELTTLAALEVDFAQGSYFGKPAPVCPTVAEAIINKIKNCRPHLEYHTLSQTVSVKIGDIVQYTPFVAPDMIIGDIGELLEGRYQGIVIVDGNLPVGLLMKNKLYYQLGTPYGVSLYLRKTAATLMDKQPLIIDAELALEIVSQMAMNRHEESQYDLIIVTKNKQYIGVVSVTHLLQQLTNLQIRFASNSNPLTGLPGNLIIEERLKQVVATAVPFAVLYCDLDNFKAFNDKYGFEHGDRVLQFTASLLRTALLEVTDDVSHSLLGHIGGDDFILLADSDKAEELCTLITEGFDREIATYYDPQDVAQRYIMIENRKGKMEQFPLMSISIGVVHNRYRTFSSYIEIGEVSARLKKKAKEIAGSSWVIDQRK